MANPNQIHTSFTNLLKIDYPLIAGAMFLVSHEELVSEVSNAGGLGAAPSLNWRTTIEFKKALQKIKALSQKSYAINLIVNKSNLRLQADLDACVEEKVPVVITSLGNPIDVIKKVHAYGGKVFCDVVNLRYAQKVQDQGCDGVIAVSSGAGGHAGPISPLVLIPHLKSRIKIPIVAAGGIANGRQILAALVLGADAVQVGTRFIASIEAPVSQEYKNAIVNAEPEDIVLTSRISGTPASVINTPFIQSRSLNLSRLENFLIKNSVTKKYAKLLRGLIGQTQLAKAANHLTWKNVWSAGQGSGLISEVLPAREIVFKMIREYWESYDAL
jgi:nitronate monooxygenase